MKKSYINLTKKFLIGTSVAIGIVFAAGCTKDAKQDIMEEDGEGTRVVLRVGDIDYGKGGPALKGKAGQAAAVSSADKTELLEKDGFEVLVSQREKGGTNSKMLGSRRNSSASNNGLRAEVMEEGFNYRIFLREQGATTGFVSEQFVSGETGSLPVEKGKIYEWYALSYNNTDDVPEGDENGQVPIMAGDGLLYATGVFDVEDVDGDVVVPLTITFKPRLTRLVIELNTMGMFAPIQSADVSVSGLYVAPEAIDIVTGQFMGDTTENLSIAFGDFTDVQGAEGHRKTMATSVAANAAEGITVRVSGLQIGLDDGSVRDFGTAFIEHAFTPEHGMEQEMLFGFVESALTRGTVSWARSNLYYTGPDNPSAPGATMSNNPYRFYHTNPRTNDPRSFFSFKGHVPRQLASANEAEQIDPCSLVYPAGRWKTPTQAELGTLTSTQGLLSNVVGGLLSTLGLGETPGMQYVTGEYIQLNPAAQGGRPATTGQSTAYGSNTSSTNVLRFNYNGIMTSIDVIEELISLELGDTYGAQAAFWTSESITDANLGGLLGGVLDLGAWSFVGRDTPTLLGRRVYGTQSLGALNIDLLGAANVVSSSLMNVRCTRDDAWDPTASGYDPNPDLSGI